MNRHLLLGLSIVAAFTSPRKAITLLTICLLAIASLEVASAAPPNIVLIIADDMNWDDCGAYGHPAIHTPNIDRLAAKGLLFKHAYLTTNSCSPSRSSIITGKYPHNTGAEQHRSRTTSLAVAQ